MILLTLLSLHARAQSLLEENKKLDALELLPPLMILHLAILQVLGLPQLLQLFMTQFGRPLLLFQITNIKFRVLEFTPSALEKNIKLLFSTKLSKLLDHRVTFNNTGTGHIKRPQLNGMTTVLVAPTIPPTVVLKSNRQHLLDGTLQLLLCNKTLELDGLNSRNAFLMIVMFHSNPIFQMLHKPTANGEPHRDLAFLESHIFAKYLRE